MAAIAYLLRKTIKNWILDLKNKPQMLIVIALVAWVLIMNAIPGGKKAVAQYNPALGSALFFVVALLFTGITLYTGLSESRTFFRMADVNLLFPAPLRPAQVIIYGMFRNIGSLGLAMLLMVYQIGTLRFTLGMPTAAIAWAFVCLFCALLLSLTTSMCLMLFCSGRPDRLTAIKYVLSGILVLLLIYLFAAARSLHTQSAATLFAALCSDTRLDFLPIVGWSRGLFVGLSSQNAALAAVCGAPMAVLFGLEVWGISHTKSDYYEDVLDGASRREVILKAARSGKRGMMNLPHKEKKNIRRFGIGAGSGASVFFHKRMLEQQRGAFGLVGFSTLIVAAAAVCLGVLLHTNFLVFLIVAAIIRLIFRRISSWEAELEKTYIYLVPDKPERKLFYVLLPEMLTAGIEAAVVLVTGAAFFHANVLTAISGALVFFSICALMTGCAAVVRRIFGNDSGNTLVQLLTIYLPMIVFGIGLVPLIIIQFVIFGHTAGYVFFYLALTAWDIGASALLLLISRGILSSAEH